MFLWCCQCWEILFSYVCRVVQPITLLDSFVPICCCGACFSLPCDVRFPVLLLSRMKGRCHCWVGVVWLCRRVFGTEDKVFGIMLLIGVECCRVRRGCLWRIPALWFETKFLLFFPFATLVCICVCACVCLELCKRLQKCFERLAIDK